MPPSPTNAVIIERLDNIQRDICDQNILLKEIRDNQAKLSTQSAVNAVDITNIKSDIDKLEKRSDRWDTINTLIAAIAASIGIFWGTNK